MRTQGTLDVGEDCGDGTAVLTFEARDVARLEMSHGDGEDNAEHLVACWNATEAVGGDPATVGKALAALRKYLQAFEAVPTEINGEPIEVPLCVAKVLMEHRDAARAILDAAKPSRPTCETCGGPMIDGVYQHRQACPHAPALTDKGRPFWRERGE